MRRYVPMLSGRSSMIVLVREEAQSHAKMMCSMTTVRASIGVQSPIAIITEKNRTSRSTVTSEPTAVAGFGSASTNAAAAGELHLKRSAILLTARALQILERPIPQEGNARASMLPCPSHPNMKLLSKRARPPGIDDANLESVGVVEAAITARGGAPFYGHWRQGGFVARQCARRATRRAIVTVVHLWR